MESKVNYTLVGLFVLALGAALIGLVLWLAVGGTEKQYDTYRVYFRESVSGLNVKALVKYRGVAVGEVAELELDPDNPEQVMVDLNIERGTPIRTDTRAVLSAQGLTGLATVELTGGSRGAGRLDRRGDEPYPVIEAGPSLVKRLDDALSKVLGDFGELSVRLQRLLGDDNQASLRALLANLDTLSAVLARRADDIDRGIAEGRHALEGGARLAAELGATAKRSRQTLAAFEDMARKLGGAGQRVDGLAQSARRDLQQLGGATPELEGLLADLRRLTEVLQRVGDTLERDPRAILIGKQPGRPGPGEE